MNKEEFDQIFNKLIIEPLCENNFKQSGKSLFYSDDSITVSLIRLGGKMSFEGSISQILCIRHSYIPSYDNLSGTALFKSIFEYPFKFKPFEIMASNRFNYVPQNLNYDYERYKWYDKETEEVTSDFNNLNEFILNKVINWAMNLSPEKVIKEINDPGLFNKRDLAWCEKIWIKSYKKKLKNA